MKTREVVLITGMTGSGKSVFFRDLIQSQPRFIILDTVKEYREMRPPFPAAFISDFPSLVAYLRANKTGSFRIIFDPRNPFELITLNDGRQVTVSELLSKIVYDGLYNVTLGIEELGKHATQKEIAPNLYNIICLGRHRQISLFATTQRAAQISTDFKAQITRFVAFRQHLPNDIGWIGECIGDPQEAESLRNLSQFIYGQGMRPGEHYKEYKL
jgi:DNA helicase HerA-like ATPase